MTIKRKKRGIGKFRGSRNCGKGNVKNRGKPSGKGGRGWAGLKKHRKTWIIKYDPDHFGRHGFVSKHKKVEELNLYEIENLIKKGQIEKKDGKYTYEFDGKILGTGEISLPVTIKALSWSKKAEEKVKKVGGEIRNIK